MMTAPNEDRFEDYWALRRRPRTRREVYRQVELTLGIYDWIEKPNTYFRVIPGDCQQDVLKDLKAGLADVDFVSWDHPWQGSLQASFAQVIRRLRPTRMSGGGPALQEPWGLLWGLTASPSFIVDDRLRGLVANKTLPRIADLFRFIFELRFEAMERKDLSFTASNIEALGSWLEGQMEFQPARVGAKPWALEPLHAPLQLDTLLFLLTLARHNQLAKPMYLVLDDVERLKFSQAEQLYNFMQGLQRWVPLGCPLRLLILWSGQEKVQLRKTHGRLAQLFRDGSKWASK